MKGFATIASPLHRLAESGVAYDWTAKCQKAFDTLKQVITSDDVMSQQAGKGHTKGDGLSRNMCDPGKCMCYDKGKVLDELPCGGCDKYKYKEWESFFELDDVVPLSAKPDGMSGDLASDHRHKPVSVCKVEAATMKKNIAHEGVKLAHVLWMTLVASIVYVLKFSTICGRSAKCTVAALRKDARHLYTY